MKLLTLRESLFKRVRQESLFKRLGYFQLFATRMLSLPISTMPCLRKFPDNFPVSREIMVPAYGLWIPDDFVITADNLAVRNHLRGARRPLSM
jgi:hypothetical protein